MNTPKTNRVMLGWVTVPFAKIDKDAIDGGIDCGCSDGSGEVSISANGCRNVGTGVEFSGVVVDCVSPVRGSGYADWSAESIRHLAQCELERNYCK